MAFAVGVRGAWWWGCGLAWPALSATGLAAPSRAGKRGGMEGPAPRGCRAVFLGSGRQRVSGPLSAQGRRLKAVRASTCLLAERSSTA